MIVTFEIRQNSTLAGEWKETLGKFWMAESCGKAPTFQLFVPTSFETKVLCQSMSMFV